MVALDASLVDADGLWEAEAEAPLLLVGWLDDADFRCTLG